MSDVLNLPLRDQAARDRILDDLDTNLLVEAGAGSGKTTALVGRMVALVETGTAQVDEIAAVTFTRKAAGELRERFQVQLEKRIRDGGGAGDSLVEERLREALDGIDRVFIGTIHAFCARLLRERPLEIGLDPAFEELAVEERVRVRQQFWASYLERLSRDADPILEELAAAGLSPSSLEGLFEKVVENPDVDFPVTISEMPSSEETRAVRAELEEIVARGWELMPERAPEKGWDSLQKKIRTAHFTREVTGWRDLSDFFEALDSLCKKGPNGHRITQKRWKEKGLAKAFCERVDEFGVGDTPARALLQRWFAHRYALAIRLVRHAEVAFAEHRKRTGRLDFQDLLVLTARLLRSHPGVRKQLGARYRRLLVDEFQDTDPLQAELMMLLSSDAVAPEEGDATESEAGDASEHSGGDVSAPIGDGSAEPDANWRVQTPRPGALFVVGDPKQSIYRFRRADIQLYGLVKRRFASFGAVLELTTNFRSTPPVGDLVNEHFASDDYFPEEATEHQASFESLNTRPVEEGGEPGGVYWYAVTPDRDTREAVTEEDAQRIASHIDTLVKAGRREPGDFLILTRKRSYLAAYARALEARSLPIQVTGAGVGVEKELRELQALLECMIDPSNPVKVVAALVGLFFGLDYEVLLQHRLEGGAFDVVDVRDRGHADVRDALRKLQAWWKTATVQPADIFVGGVVTELGLLPYAASGDLGGLRAGALVYALDAVRAAALAGDASLPGALRALRSALDLSEAEAPLEPGRPGVVRLMNLHQAKGLEAKVVFLADPTGAWIRPPDMHMTRNAEGQAVGYLRVTQARAGRGGDRVLARPEGWPEKEKAEALFDAAEEVRLLYVAVTRAAKELLVARWPKKVASSPWAPLDSWLLARGTQIDLEIVEPDPRETVDVGLAEIVASEERAANTLRALGLPSFRHRSVTDLAKSQADDEAPPGPAAASPGRRAEGASRYRGLSWGSAVHGALAAAAEGVRGESLRGACRDLLVENSRPLDDHGDPKELTELLGVVDAVVASDLWSRAHRAERVLAEVPFSVGHERIGATEPPAQAPTENPSPPRKQLDLFGQVIEDTVREPAGPVAEVAAEGPREILEGVIDLAFREKDGWVIADYKTDVGTDPDFPVRSLGYRRQVELYAEAWARLTGEPVKERVLFYTSQDRTESW